MTDPDQDNYKIEDIMQRLKSRGQQGSNDEPQLVTRDDGTQAVRVKKRKRRSHQPHKEEEKKRRKRSLLVVAFGGGGILLIGLALLVWLLVMNSESYQNDVEARIEEWTGAKVEMRSFRATPVSAGMDLIQARWPESSPVAFIRLNNVQTDLRLSSHLTGVWRGEQLTAGAGELILRDVEPTDQAGRMLPDADLPFRMPMRVSRFRVNFGDGDRPAMVLSDATASFMVPNSSVSEASIILEGGKSRIGKWGRFDLKLASFGLSSQGLKLSRLRISPEAHPAAEIQLNGDGYPPVPIRGGVGEFGFLVEKVPTELLLGKNLGEMIDGVFAADRARPGVCQLDPTDLSSIKFEVAVRSMESQTLTLRRFAFLETLSHELGHKRILTPLFNPGGRMEIQRDAETTELQDLDLLAEGMLRVRGDLREERGKLSGRLKIGLSEAIVAASPSRTVPMLFRRGEDGYFWATIELSGTTRAPQDNLKSLLELAASEQSPSSGGSNELDREFIDLTTPEE